MHTLWNTILYQPLYNLLIGIINHMPGKSVGLAVIALTILVKLVLFPLTQRSIESQLKMKTVEADVAQIKLDVPDKTEQNKRIYALYKERKVNPFSSCLLILVQIPIIIALYYVFLHGLGTAAPVALYSFVHTPPVFNMRFLATDLSAHSIVFAILAGIAQFFSAKLAQGRQGKPTGEGMQAEFAKSMQTQMIYILPLMIIFIAWRVSAAVALYWITSNIFTVGQELYTRYRIRKMAKA